MNISNAIQDYLEDNNSDIIEWEQGFLESIQK